MSCQNLEPARQKTVGKIAQRNFFCFFSNGSSVKWFPWIFLLFRTVGFKPRPKKKHQQALGYRLAPASLRFWASFCRSFCTGRPAQPKSWFCHKNQSKFTITRKKNEIRMRFLKIFNPTDSDVRIGIPT